MSDFFIALGIGWIAVTLVGHASWLIVEKFIRLFTSPKDQAGTNVRDRSSIAKSVIQGLHQEGRIDSGTVTKVVSAINQSESGIPLNPLDQPALATSSVGRNKTAADQDTDAVVSSGDGFQIDDPLKSARTTEGSEPEIIMARVIDESKPPTPIESPTNPAANIPGSDNQKQERISSLLDPITPASSQTNTKEHQQALQVDPASQPSEAANTSSNAADQKPNTTISMGEIIQSFLSAHNIRWGELIAGTLIVVCSIGLVISLWGPLVQTHRAIPTLIFLAANAAIYSVGLYTLSRWRLRHTSRAVLIIATLLIPLSVLAGMAASGIDATQAIDLSDPITLGTIGLAGLVYSVFLYLGGKALTSRTHVWTIFTAVAGSVLALVLSPAAIRAFENQAGWLIAIGSSSVIFACVMLGNLNRRRFTSLGPAGARLRLLVMGLSVYSLAITTISMGYHLRGFAPSALLPLAMALIPACIALAGVASSLRERSRNSTISMIGAVCCVLLSAITLVIVAPAMSSPTWLWTWALTMSISLVAGRYLLQQPSWFAISTIPIGLVAICTAQVWLGGQTWQTSALFAKFLNGEAMAASLLMCLTSGSLCWVSSKSPAKKWLLYANMGWCGATLLIAAALSLAPESQMGVMPTWVITATLFAAALATFLFSIRDYRADYLTVVITALAFNSIYRVTPSLSLDNLPNWLYLTLSVAVILTILSELSCRLALRFNDGCVENASLVRKQLAHISLATVGIAILLAVIGTRSHFELSCATHVISAAILVWISLLLGNLNIFKIAQLPTLLLTVSLTRHFFEAELWTQAGWVNGQAIWGWSVVLGALAVFWYLLRAATNFYLSRFAGNAPISGLSTEVGHNTSFRDRASLLLGQPIRPLEMPDTWFGLASSSLATAATTYLFFCLNRFTISQLPLDYNTSWVMPVLGWLSVGVFAALLAKQKVQREITCTLIGLLGIIFTLWFSCQLTTSILSDVKMTLIISVSLATTLGFAAKTALRYTNSTLLTPHFVNGCNATQCFVLLTASISLLYSGVYLPVEAGQLADVASALSIATWWLIVSMLALWETKQHGKAWSLVVSALFFAASGCVLATPFVIFTPITQIQIACLLTFAWLPLASRFARLNKDVSEETDQVFYLHEILRLMVFAGIITSVSCTVCVFLNHSVLDGLLSPASIMVSALAAASMASSRVESFLSGTSDPKWSISLPFSLSLLAGQIAWILHELNITTGSLGGPQSVEIIAAVWIAAAVASILMPGRRQQAVDFYHMAAVTLVTMIAAIYYQGKSDILPWLSLLATATSGAQITLMSAGMKPLNVPVVAARMLGWLVGAAGIVLIWQFMEFHTSYVTLWIAAWVLIWRYVGRDRMATDRESKQMYDLPSLEFSILLLAIAFADIAFSLGFFADFHSLDNPMLWLRSSCYALTAISVVFRPRTSGDWFVSLMMLSTAFSLLVIAATKMLGGAPADQYTAAIISYAFFFAASTTSLGNLAKLAGWTTSSPAGVHFKRLVSTTTSILTIFAVVSVGSPIIMMIVQLPLPEIQLAIVSVAMIAWAFAEVSEQASLAKLRYVAVSLALVAIALWASASSLDNEYLLLTTCMRWLVASALIIPTLLFVLPKILGSGIRTRWMDAFQKGAITAGMAGIGSTFAMITLEFLSRDSNGLETLPLVAVIGAAITLGVLSLMCGATALATGPKGYLRLTLSLTDQQRTYLLLATQLLGFLTWLHLFLCKPAWAFMGLKEHWPYVVMGLAFATVGITEFARRRGDTVMSTTIRKTSLYLPLIPVLGLWLSASNQGGLFFSNMIKSNYEILLVMAAVYYLAVGTLWKATMPRVTGVILGNAAWWFVLIQLPGWGFMMHPQLWLIPPAACVLVMTHFYRERLDPKLASGIRYGSTLLIYISSSADMLLQQIGTTLAGPIVLILLALTGMLLGVVLRIRPFLYLGATFVFLGVTSMVWHANRAFDSTWPWWVFGISMGLVLLAGLMMLEKFKPQLQAYAKSLSSWEA